MGNSRFGLKGGLNRVSEIRRFFDQEASRYFVERYEAQTVDSYFYNLRKDLALSLLGSSYYVLVDLGCGPGIYLRDLMERGKLVIGTDFSGGMLKCASSCGLVKSDHYRISLVRSKVTDLCFRDNSVDGIVCIGVLPYLDEYDLKISLKEMHRVLTRGGQAILQVSSLYSPVRFIYDSVWSVHRKISELFKHDDHGVDFRLYPRSRGYMEKVLSCVGLRIIAIRYYDLRFPFLESISDRTAISLARYFNNSGWMQTAGQFCQGYLMKVTKQ
jgi:ubiquinone/menaquinone biosynthesis C-methylase UbiE